MVSDRTDKRLQFNGIHEEQENLGERDRQRPSTGKGRDVGADTSGRARITVSKQTQRLSAPISILGCALCSHMDSERSREIRGSCG